MTEPALGIDIAKLKFNACLINQGGKLKHKVFPNTATGFEQLTEWLLRQGVERVDAYLEATGTYGDALSLFLHQTGHTVSIINPAVKAFAQSRLSRTKTDRVDAETDRSLLPRASTACMDASTGRSAGVTSTCAPTRVAH